MFFEAIGYTYTYLWIYLSVRSHVRLGRNAQRPGVLDVVRDDCRVEF